MVGQKYILPKQTTPQLSQDVPALDTRNLNYSRDCSSGNPINLLIFLAGFYPSRTAVITPRPWNENFAWSTSYGRPFVEANQASNASGKKALTFKVIVYKGLGNNYNADQEFVYIGYSRLLFTGLQHTYMRLCDLEARLGDGCQTKYNTDRQVYGAAINAESKKAAGGVWDLEQWKQLPFNVWDAGTGTAATNVHRISENNAGWKNYYLVLYKPLGTVDFSKDVVPQLNKDEGLFAKFCGELPDVVLLISSLTFLFADLAAAATYPVKESWDVLSRFFDAKVDGIKLFFRVNPLFDRNLFRQIVDGVIAEARARGTPSLTNWNPKQPFIPEECEFLDLPYPDPYTGDTTDWKNGKMMIGRHPEDLYDVWVDGVTLMSTLGPAGMYHRHYEISTAFKNNPIVGNNVSLRDSDNRTVSIPKGSWTDGTETVVTSIKINSARNMARRPDQAGVMGIGSNAVSTHLLSSHALSDLHRSQAARNIWKSEIGTINDAEVSISRSLISL